MHKQRTLIIMLLLLNITVIYNQTPEEYRAEEKGYIEKAPEKYHSLLRSIQFKYGIPEELLYVLPEMESGWNENALSSANCISLTQLNPKYKDWFEENFWGYKVVFDIYNPYHNLEVGFHYLSWLRSQTHSWEEALMAYNGGLTTVNRYLEHGVALPGETLDYVIKARKLGVRLN